MAVTLTAMTGDDAQDDVTVDRNPETGAVVRLACTVELGEPWASWALARASAWGEPVPEHLASLIRHFWAHHDMWRHGRTDAATQPAGGAREP